jgi:hypothetical protein
MEHSKNNYTEVPHSYQLSMAYKFFCWCSGARLYLLSSCPTDYNKFFGIGITVFLTGIMASITGFYALFVIFGSVPISVVFGIFWGILIFFLDWFIVASLKKENKISSELLFTFPRIILAILLSIVISRPLELKLFEKEINAQLQSIHSASTIKYNQLIDKEYENITLLKKENERLNSEVQKKEEQRDQLFNLMIEEAEGRSATSKIGKGAVYKEKKAEYDKVDEELNLLKQKNGKQIDQNLKSLVALEQNKQEQNKKSTTEIKQADGLLARFEAMSVLTKNNPTLNLTSWFIFILFIMIEASPIIVKLLSQRGPYDELLEKEEYEKLIEYKKQKIKAKVLANNYLELLRQKDELQTESEKRNNENLVKEIEAAKDEINRIFVGKWKQSEIETINRRLVKEIQEDDLQRNEILKTEEPVDALYNDNIEEGNSGNIVVNMHDISPKDENEIYEQDLDGSKKDINS